MTIKNSRPQGGKNSELLVKPTSLALTAGQMVQQSVTTGLFESCGTGTVANQIIWIANDTITALQALANFLGTVIFKTTDEYIVSTANNSDVAHNGQRMIITAGGLTVTNSGTDVATGVFQQTGVVGAAADKLIKVRKV